MTSPAGPTADRSVRPARPDDAPALGTLQSVAWRDAYARVLPAEELAALDPGELARSWAVAIRQAPSARHHVLVAAEGEVPVGFAALAPAGDPDLHPGTGTELLTLVVGPGRRGRGHGSRLLSASAEVVRNDGVQELTTWVGADEDAVRAFLEAAGWAPDGATRELDLRGDGAVVVRQLRLHTAVA